MKDFDSWNSKKQQLNNSDKALYFNTREVWWLYLGANVGFEQDGKNQDFVRPILIPREFNKQLFLSVPLSTQIKPQNRFYAPLQHNDKTFSAVISQIRLFDSRRLKRKMYRLDEPQFSAVQDRVIIMTREEN